MITVIDTQTGEITLDPTDAPSFPRSAEEVRASMPALSRRQVLIMLATQGLISNAEATAWAIGGTLPASIAAVVATLPAHQQTAASITLGTFTDAFRTDPMVALLAAASPVALTDEALDDLWTAFAQV